jgi:exodeoxyribonuclease VII small subunit
LNGPVRNGAPVEDPPSFEHSLSALEAVVHDLEEGQLGLTEALARYEEGVKHLKHCYQLLEGAERKIELLTGVAEDGTHCTEPFDESTEPLADSAGRRRRRAKATPSAPANIAPANSDVQRDIDASGDST